MVNDVPTQTGQGKPRPVAGAEGVTGLAQTFEVAYDDLRSVARAQLSRLRPGETLDTTALIHEAYLRMEGQSRVTLADRANFFAYSATVMRSVIVDFARRKSALKRGAGAPHLSLDDGLDGSAQQSEMILALDDALRHLSSIDPRLEKVVDCRFFGGMTEVETASAVGISERTVRRDWRRAKGWLYGYLTDAGVAGTPPLHGTRA